MNTRLMLVMLVVSLTAASGCTSNQSAAENGQQPTGRAVGQTSNHPAKEKAAADSNVKPAAPDQVGTLAAKEKRHEPNPQAEAALDSNEAGKKWTDAAGKVLAVGELVALMDENVCLETASGGGIVVPFNQLCQADQQYVREQVGSDASEPEDAAEPADQVASAGSDSPPADEDQGPLPRRTLDDTGSSRRRKVVIPFDFVSKFDEGRYGGMVGDMIWKKLEREGAFIIPDSMSDVRDLCTANNVKITPDTPLDKVREVVRNHFDADVGIWGSVERAPGQEWEIYDLTIKCVDFSVYPKPKTVYEKTNVRTNSVSEIPHLYLKQMLDALYERQPLGPPPVDQLAEENWINNPNLVTGGDFQRGSRGVPDGWESRGGQEREPLGGLVRWIAEEGGSSGNRVIRFTFDKGVGDGYGVMYYCKIFSVEEGATYRFQCRYRTNGPAVKVFIKCYDRMSSEYTPDGSYRPKSGRSQRGGDGYQPKGNDYVPDLDKLRECYRSQQNLKGPKNTWNTQTQDFTPKHTKYTPQWGRVMLYAYLGAGVVEFDDVVLKQIVPASPSDSKKTLRHSLESDVTLDEMRENEERGRQVKEKMQKGKEEK